MKNGKANGGFLATTGLTSWNIVLLIMIIVGTVANAVRYQTHFTDFEKTTVARAFRIEEDVSQLEQLLRPTQIDMARMQITVQSIYRDVEAMRSKMDSFLSGIGK